MSVNKRDFGLAYGYKTYLFTLKNKNGMTVRVTNFGACIAGIDVPDKDGAFADVVLGYDDIDGYVGGNSSHGAVVGRFANRIGGAQFTLNGTTYHLTKNDGENTLHGGAYSFNKRVWLVEGYNGESVLFMYRSPDMEENFPGNLELHVKYTLTDDNRLTIEYTATTDEDTIINITNHSYFNLGGCDGGSVASILDTELQIFADGYTPVDKGLIPLGSIAPVKGTVYDFTEPKAIGTDIRSGKTDGYDHNFILGELGEMKKAAIATDNKSGRVMTTYTTMPAMQLYTANGLSETGKHGSFTGKQDAFCLETQFTPNTPNMPDFPSCVLKRGEVYNHKTIYEFSVKEGK